MSVMLRSESTVADLNNTVFASNVSFELLTVEHAAPAAFLSRDESSEPQ